MRGRILVAAAFAATLLLPGAAHAEPSPSSSVTKPWPQPGAGAKSAKPQKMSGDPASVQEVRKPLLLVEENVEKTEGASFTLSAKVLFEFGKATLTDKAMASIQEVANRMKKAGVTGGVQVIGHTDDVDSKKKNQQLSEQRAKAVKQALQPLLGNTGIELTAEGKGETEPLVPNDSKEQRARNRRVAIVYEPQGGSSSGQPTDQDTYIGVSAAKPAPPGLGPAPQGAIASTQRTIEGSNGGKYTARLDLMELKRQGKLVFVGMQVKLLNNNTEYTVATSTLFTGDSASADKPMGRTALYDYKAGKKLKVAVNGEGSALYSSSAESSLARGKSLFVWAFFPAPQGKKVSLYVPAFGVLSDLQVK